MAETILTVISREDARALGLKRYFTGVPCVKGHVSERRTLSGVCVECKRIWVEKYFARPGAKERHKVAVDARYQRHKEDVNARAIAWRKRNPEKARVSNRKAVKSDNHKKATIRWRKNHPDMVRASDRTKRAKRKKAEGRHTAEDVLNILRQQKYRCANCAVSVKDRYHVDHVMPLVKGGSNWPDNLQILCPTCNNKKHSKDPIQWANENGRLL